MRIRPMMIVAAVSLGALGAAACGDESSTGPRFGDLSFTPSFENIGDERTIELMLTNTGSVELGPIVVGNDFPKNVDFPDAICTTIDVTITPSNLSSLAPGGDALVEVVIDTSAMDSDCDLVQYDLDVFAAVDSQVLGGATVRFNTGP